MINAIIPECYVDTCLINILLNVGGKESANHAKGNSSVAAKMKGVFNDAFAVGIIDMDKREIEYIKEFELCNDTMPDKLLLYKHPNKHHYFIQLCPESESWICTVSNELSIDIGNDYGLPNNPQELSKESKYVNVGTDSRFVKLFKEIKRRSIETNYEPVLKLMYWLTELKENNYSVNIDNLTN